MLRLALVFSAALAACESRNDKPPSPTSPPSATAPSARTPASTRPRASLRAATRPTLPPALPSSAVAWSAAEQSNSAAAWDTAAQAYEAELATCAHDCRETAYAVVLARRNAMLAEPLEAPPGDAPVPLPPRVQAVVDALDAYVATAEPGDPDVAAMKFLAGNALRRWRQPESLARLEDVLRNHRDDPTAEYAANLLLDALMRANRIDEVRRWVAELLGDSAFLAGKDELRQTLERIRSLI